MKFSVLMSLYDREKPEYLDESLKSIIVNQEIKPDEIVLVLDGPININLKNIIEKYNKKFKKFKIIKLEKNIGLGLALRRGLKECENNLVFRMDTDDISHRERFKRQIEFFKKNPKVKILGTNAKDFNINIRNEINNRVFPENNNEIKKFSKRRCPFLHPTIGFYKNIVLEVGNYRDLLFFEDYDLFLRILKKYEGHNLQEYLLHFRSNDQTFERRGGFNYLKNELRAFSKFKNEELLSFKECIVSLIPRILIRVVGNKLRKFIYKKYMREEKNGK